MSNATVSAAEGAAVVVDPANSNTPAAAPAGKPAATPAEKPEWLDARLEQHGRSILKQLGVESLEDAKKAVEKMRSVEEAQKSDAQKRGELETTLKTEREQKQALADALGSYAKAQMGSLTDAQRNAVAAVAGDDPAKQLKTIEALKPTWASAAAAAAPATAPVQDTAPAPAAPKDGATSLTPPDAKSVYEELKATNPILAARYALANGVFETK